MLLEYAATTLNLMKGSFISTVCVATMKKTSVCVLEIIGWHTAQNAMSTIMVNDLVARTVQESNGENCRVYEDLASRGYAFPERKRCHTAITSCYEWMYKECNTTK